MQQRKMQVVLLVLGAVGAALGSPSGAPVAACDTLTPQHGSAAQTAPCPFALYAQPIGATAYNVTVVAGDGTNFRGFILQARDATGTRVGTFDAAGAAQATDCPPGTANSATHVDRTDKSYVSVTWNAPSQGVDGINFHFSVVQEKDIFWANQVTPLIV